MIDVYKFDEKAKLPTRANYTDAGLDLFSNEEVFIQLGETITISTGVAVHIPKGSVGKIEDRSSLAAKGLRTGGGVIDAGFNGEIKIVLHNFSAKDAYKPLPLDEMSCPHQKYQKERMGTLINLHDAIAQLLVYKVENVPAVETKILWDSKRGAEGFGSSDKLYGPKN